MSHTMTNGQPCGRPDGHTGHHRSVESMERRRAARREWDRRAWAEGRKHWQRHPVSREHYDAARLAYNGPVRNCQAIIGLKERLAALGHSRGPDQADLDELERWKVKGREMARRWYALHRDHVMVKLGPRRWWAIPRDCMAAFDPRVDAATAVPYPAQDREELDRQKRART